MDVRRRTTLASVAPRAVLLFAIAASACSRNKLAPAAKSSSADTTSFGSTTSAERPEAGELHVVVVDEAGAPLAGVSVTGSSMKNPGPMASTCCFPESLGDEKTDRNGVAVLEAPPFTFREVEVTASREGWPPRRVSLTFGDRDVEKDSWGRVVIRLGPARDLRGRVDMGPDCPPGFLEVRGMPPPVRAPVDDDGRFVLRGLSPGKVTIGFSACGRDASATAEPGAKDPIVLVLPARKPGKWPFDVQPSAMPPAAAAPKAPLPCLLPGGELVTAGDFDSVLVDDRCRFVLAGKRTMTRRYEASNWTLVRPDGTKLPIGSNRRGSPDIGDDIVYLSVPGDETTLEVVDFVRGKREVVHPPAHFVPAAGDTAVLARQAITQGGTQAHELEIRWPDGTRRKLPGAALSWSLISDKKFLVYGVVPGKSSDQDVHLLDLTTRIDRIVSKGAMTSYAVDEGRTLVIPAERQVTVYDIDKNTRGVLRGSGYQWRVFGRDLALKTEKDGSASLRKPNQTLPLSFRWPSNARERRLADRFLFFGDEGHAVLVDTATGIPRALASGVQVSDHIPPPISGDLVALSEKSGRVLIASLSGAPLRAVGRGMPRAFSPDGRWLQVVRDVEYEITLAPIAANEAAVTVRGWGGTFAPDAPALFFHTGVGAYDEPRALYATYPAAGRTVEIEPRVLSYAVLQGGEVLVVVPPGSSRPAGIYRRKVPVGSP
jgi:hypothetical protein